MSRVERLAALLGRRRRLGGTDAGGKRGALLLQRDDLVQELLAIVTGRGEGLALEVARGGQLVAAGHEPVADDTLLGGSRRDDARRRGHLGARQARSLALPASRPSRRARGSRCARPAGRSAQVVELLDQVVEAVRREDVGDGIGRVLHVELDDAAVEAADGDAVLALEEPEPLSLQLSR